MRILLKLSGEFIADGRFIKTILELSKRHVVGIVPGGGNIIRGRDVESENRALADTTGIYSTIINGLILKAALPEAKVLNSFNTRYVEEFAVEKIANLSIFTGGLYPYFSTDSLAAVRAIDMKADMIVKATKVDGVYDMSPENPGAKLLKKTTYAEVLEKNLNIIDMTAASLAQAHKIPMVVFNGNYPEQLEQAMQKSVGTVIV